MIKSLRSAKDNFRKENNMINNKNKPTSQVAEEFRDLLRGYLNQSTNTPTEPILPSYFNSLEFEDFGK